MKAESCCRRHEPKSSCAGPFGGRVNCTSLSRLDGVAVSVGCGIQTGTLSPELGGGKTNQTSVEEAVASTGPLASS